MDYGSYILTKHHRDVDRFYVWLAACQYETEIAEHYQKRLVRNRNRLFEFLNHDGVPWNNNNAENAIKPFAKYRAMAGDLGTYKGLEDYLVLLSIQQTCKYRGISFLEFLRSGKSTLEL
jgi:Transposase IS66 family